MAADYQRTGEPALAHVAALLMARNDRDIFDKAKMGLFLTNQIVASDKEA